MLVGRTNRRAFIAGLGGAAAWPLVTLAQPSGMPLIGFLSSRSPIEAASFVAAFRRGLAEGGFPEGQNVALTFRWAEGQYDKLPELAADLVRRQVTVIATGGGSAPTLAAKAATSDIPARGSVNRSALEWSRALVGPRGTLPE